MNERKIIILVNRHLDRLLRDETAEERAKRRRRNIALGLGAGLLAAGAGVALGKKLLSKGSKSVASGKSASTTRKSASTARQQGNVTNKASTSTKPNSYNVTSNTASREGVRNAIKSGQTLRFE